MLIDHKNKWIFFHIQRTGGTSLRNALLRSSPHKLEERITHENAKTLSPAFFTTHHNYFKFGFVRNPWSRHLSWYLLLQNSSGKKPSITQHQQQYEAYLEHLFQEKPPRKRDPYFPPNQMDFFLDQRKNLQIDEIGRFENYAQDVQRIGQKINLRLVGLSVLNKVKRKPYHLYYTPKSKAMIEQYCKKDIDYFGYQFKDK